jgi:hypothetical protein
MPTWVIAGGLLVRAPAVKDGPKPNRLPSGNG